MRRPVLDWYHFYLNHPGGSRLAKIIREVCYWKILVTQADMFAKMCNTCQQFKKGKTVYGSMSPKNIAKLKMWDTVHVYLIVPYSKSIRQHQHGGTIINNNVSLTCMSIIDPAKGWFEIIEVTMFDLNEVTEGNDEYIDK